MKAILKSERPKSCELILNGEKTMLLSKTRPKLDTPFKCYIYCIMGDVRLNSSSYTRWYGGNDIVYGKSDEISNGKVIGEFVCDSISCFDVDCYVGEKICYGWHISDLKIYDTPKELGEFRTAKEPKLIYNKDGRITTVSPCIVSPPRSWQYVEELED